MKVNVLLRKLRVRLPAATLVSQNQTVYEYTTGANAMTDQKKPPSKRPRGRPALRSEGETRTLLLGAARTEFLAQGYAPTSIESVAQKAGMSTRTIYRTVANKADLFRLVIEDAIESSIAHLNERPVAASPPDALFSLVRSYARLVLGHEGVQTARAVMAEQAQFPELRESYRASIKQVAAAFDDRLEALCAEMRADVTGDDAAVLRSMINGAQRSAILDPDHVATIAEVCAWADKCTRLFLRAHGIAGY